MIMGNNLLNVDCVPNPTQRIFTCVIPCNGHVKSLGGRSFS